MLVDPAWHIGGADLVWREWTCFLHITQTADAPKTAVIGGVRGVDLGQVRLAADSDGDHFSGAKVKGMRHHYAKRRAILQQVGTKRAKRRLTRITTQGVPLPARREPRDQ